MKILMLNPPDENTVIEYPDENGEGYLEADDFGAFPPLGALYVLSYLEKNSDGHELFFKDCVGERVDHRALGAYIGQIQPDVVGITSFTIALIDAIKAAQTVREMAPQAHICMGGHHPIAFPVEAAQLDAFDSIVVGEGEIAFTGLVKALESGEDITAIPGVYTKSSMEKWRNQPFQDKRFLSSVTVPPGYIDDIDSLPPPNRQFIQHIDYKSIVGVTGRLATLISSRGCPYLCTFCDVPYKRYRRRAVEKVVDEVEACLAMGYQEVHFYDDLFNVSPRRVIEFCDEVDRRGIKFPWDFRGRVNGVDQESLTRAKKSGCRLISFGVETGNDEGLAQLKKGITTAQVRQAFRWCRELGVQTVADFIIGLPSEPSAEAIQANIDFAIDLDPDYGQFSILSLYPNTPLYDQAIEQGLVDRERWRRWVLDPTPGFVVDHWEAFVPILEQVRLQRQAYRRFYTRPRYILRSIWRTRTLYQFKTKFGGFLKLFR